MRSCLMACHSVLFSNQETKRCILMMDQICKNSSYESNLLAVLWTSNEWFFASNPLLSRELGPSRVVLLGHNMYMVRLYLDTLV